MSEVLKQTAEIISFEESQLTPQQKWRAKIKENPEKYKDYLESVKTKKREAYHRSRVGKEDKRSDVILTENGRVCLSCNSGKPWDQFSKDIHGYNKKTATCLSCRREKFKKVYKENPS